MRLPLLAMFIIATACGGPRGSKGQDLSEEKNAVASAELADDASPAVPAVQKSSYSFPSDLEIKLERKGCAFRCSEYSIRLTPPGQVGFAGISSVYTLGDQTGEISEESLWTLWKRFKDIGFLDSTASFGDKDPDCWVSATDGETQMLTLTANGVSNSIELYGACWVVRLMDVELTETVILYDALMDLAAEVDSRSNVSRWVEGELKDALVHSDVQAVFDRNASQLRECFKGKTSTSASAKEQAFAHIMVQMGTVTEINLVGINNSVTDCLHRRIGRWRFPRAPDSIHKISVAP